MGYAGRPEQQQIIIETVRESSLLTRVLLALVPVIGGAIFAWFRRKR